MKFGSVILLRCVDELVLCIELIRMANFTPPPMQMAIELDST